MHVLLVADGRSPITRRWHQALAQQGLRVSLVSTFPCEPLPGLEHFSVIPVAFSRLASRRATSAVTPAAAPSSGARKLVERFRGTLLVGRYYLGPLSVDLAARAFRQAVAEAQPDLIHALRIPYEGMLARLAPAAIPLIVSIWGNDLTLHAHGSPWMGRLTRQTLRRAQGLMADAQRDVRLAPRWGLRQGTPTLVVPGSGGLPLEEIQARRESVADLLGEYADEQTPILVNPRGFRVGSVRNDTFFQALPRLLERCPALRVLCPAMQGQPEALRWVERLGLDARVRLLPLLPQPRLWDLYHRAEVFVSPSQHDGTPNSMLEGMACACFPVAGDIESIREWITPGVNGLLVEPGDPEQLSAALEEALSNAGLRRKAADYNQRLVSARAGREPVSLKVREFYEAVVSVGSGRL